MEKQVWYLYRMEYYAAMKRNEVLIRAVLLMGLGSVMLPNSFLNDVPCLYGYGGAPG